jgi:hypothetical protein
MGLGVGLTTPHRKNISLLRSVTTGLRPGRILWINKNGSYIGWNGIDWIDLAQDRDQWRALVKMVMNLWVP